MGQKAKDGSLKAVWRDWKWIWSFSRKRRGAVVLYTLCGILSSGLGLLAGVLGKYLIDAIIAMDTTRLLWCCAFTVASAALGVIFQSLTSRFSAKLSINMHNDVQAAVFDNVLQSDWMELSRYASGDLANRFSSDASTVANCAVSWLPNLIIQMFSVLSTLIVILYFDPIMALIGCASTPILFLISRRLMRQQRRAARSSMQYRESPSRWKMAPLPEARPSSGVSSRSSPSGSTVTSAPFCTNHRRPFCSTSGC